MLRSRRQAAALQAVPTKDYKVLVSFSHKHVVVPVGTILALTDAEAKYHLLASRVALVIDAPAPVQTPVFMPAPVAVADTSSDSSKK